MSEAGLPIAARDWRQETAGAAQPASAPAGASSPQDTCPYYILYYADASTSGVMGPMKRARYATVREAADRAMEMRRAGNQRPVEIRDPQDHLITCELMGWKLPPLVRPEHPRRPSVPAARIA
ncbi:hypothetical protein AncyloWKF20_09935 [Ancylobacter sp. WKF20]|uniref:hypothetical protein n=1 Tax=Ancylobacter sp. WKF20 TaxID=3039801 RepID=UPI00243461E3|nr:hypothetical protein [Ancylobacter sp. WKF20]WGD32109.1 hypothetical protein AncyloWKF20_09935 [Ancylobacter sp. WKF20]